MTIDDVIGFLGSGQFPRRTDDSHPTRPAVRELRGVLESALTSADFLISCISIEMLLFESGVRRVGLTPFLVVPDLGVRFALGYWPPGETPGPHEHTAWTATAVCTNELDVSTFDRPESIRTQSLVSKNTFRTSVGQVGFIYEPSIHAPKNNSRGWTLSLHVSSPRDGQPTDDGGELSFLRDRTRLRSWDSSPAAQVAHRRFQCGQLEILANVLSSFGPSAKDVLSRCLALSSRATQRRYYGVKGGHLAHSRFVRTDARLELEVQIVGSHVHLMVHDGVHRWRAIVANHAAHEALCFVATAGSFDLRDLPSQLTGSEREGVLDILEHTGLFHGVAT